MLSFDINEYDIYSEKDLSAAGSAVLKKKEGRTIKSGGLWVYDNEIAEFKGAFEDGSIIAVEDFDGYFMGYGFVNRRSKITVRLLSRRREHPVTPALLTQRVRDAPPQGTYPCGARKSPVGGRHTGPRHLRAQ